MDSAFRVAGAQWTAAHRAFPLLTGLGVAVALIVVSWIPPPMRFPFAFFILPLLIAPSLSALSALGIRSTVPWLAARHAVAALAAVGTAMAATALVALLFHANADALRPADLPAVIMPSSSLAGWLALQFERFADRGTGLPPFGRTRWNPRRWGVAGATGVALFIALMTAPAWAFLLVLPHGGGFGIVWYYGLWAGVVAVVSLVIGLTVEAVLASDTRPRRGA
jgi:hypothetical protein